METPTIPQPTGTSHESDAPEQPKTPAMEPAPRVNESGTEPLSPGVPYRSAYPPMQYSPQPYPSYPPAPMPPRDNRPWIIGGVVAAFLLIGLVVALLIAMVAGLALGGGGIGTMHSSVTTRTLAVQGTPTVVVTNAVGNVHFIGGRSSTVTVQITKHVRAVDNAAAQTALDGIGVIITQQGSSIAITTEFPAAGMGMMTQSRSVDYAITVPAGSSVRSDVSAGNIDVANTTGTLTLTSSAGNVTATSVAFGAGSVLRTSAGNVIASGSLAPGGSLHVRVSTGNATVELPAGTAAHLDADVSVGNLTITGFPVATTSTGFTGHHASGDTGAHPQGLVNITVATGNVTITAR